MCIAPSILTHGKRGTRMRGALERKLVYVQRTNFAGGNPVWAGGRSLDWAERYEAARATRVSRSLAAFHLEKLVEADLLQATFRRLRGGGGPGAGRPSKVYRRSSTQFDLSLPQRRYELAAQVLAQALANAQS